MTRSSSLVGPVRIALLSGALVVSTATFALAAPFGTARAAATAPDPTYVSGASALAAQTGAPVVVSSMTTDSDQTLANPDGTLTLQTSAAPVRVRTSSGWTPVDPTLVQSSDGSWTPRAVDAQMRFSGGGSGAALASITSSGASFTLGWPSPLPVPTASGASLTYPSVLPGVDLQVTASAEAFSEVLVVKTAAAAAQPALRTVSFLTSSTSPAVGDGAGGFVVNNAFGSAVLRSAEPAMWDSSAANVSSAPSAAAAPLASGSAAQLTGSDPSVGEDIPLPVSLSSKGLSIVPSQAILTSSATVFPVYIDPTVSAGRTAWAMVDKAYPTTSYYKWTDADQGDGYNDVSGVHTKRLFYEFSTAAVAAQKITAATLTATETFSYDCSITQIDAKLVGTSGYASGSLSGSTTWNAQPGVSTVVASATPKGVRNPAPNANCSTANQPTIFNVLPAITSSAGSKANYTTFGLYAHNESADQNWHRFTAAAVLSITYDRAPAVPTSTKTTTPSTSCTTGTGRPLINSTTPTLNATGTDPDGGTVGVNFTISPTGQPSVTTWSYTWPAASRKTSGYVFQVAVPAGKLTTGNTYSWRADTSDGTLTSGYSGWCEFTVDTTKPNGPTFGTPTTSATGKTYPAYAIPVSSTSTDVKTFKWSFNNDGYGTSTAATAGTSPSAAITVQPTAFGPQTLYVESADAAGNISTPSTYSFTVDQPNALQYPAHSYQFDSRAPSSEPDAGSPGGQPLSLNAVTYASGRDAGQCPSDYAAVFNGSSSGAVTSGSPIDTSANFTVAADVYLPSGYSTGVYHDALVIGDATSNIATLGLITTGYWGGTFYGTDGKVYHVTDQVLPVLDSWEHLAMVYDAGDKEVDFYVDGELVDSLNDIGMRAETGNVYVGRGLVPGAADQQWWPGAVDDVETFAGAFPSDTATGSSQIATLSNQQHCAPPPPT